jgi:hypothetical protein
LRPVKLCLQKRTWSRDKNIHFEHGLTMNDVEAGVTLNGFGDHLFINVKLVLQRRDKLLLMFRAHLYDNV